MLSFLINPAVPTTVAEGVQVQAIKKWMRYRHRIQELVAELNGW